MNDAIAESQSKTMLDAALEYARQAWRVFPVKPAGKTPLTAHGLKDATTDEEQIRAWWTEWPTANIGFATGSGIVVVDIDDLGSWFDLIEDANVPGPDTSRVATASGWHLFFRSDAPIRNSAGKLRAGIDIRGAGGYVILPPSRHETGHVYEWHKNGTPDELPGWLLERLTTKPEASRAPEKPAAEHAASAAGSQYGRAALEDEARNVALAPEGQRNHTLNVAAFSLGQLVGGGELDKHDVRTALEDAARACGLPEQEATATIDSAAEDADGGAHYHAETAAETT